MNAMNVKSTAATSMPLPAPVAPTPVQPKSLGALPVQPAQPSLEAPQAALAPVQPAVQSALAPAQPAAQSAPQSPPTPVQPKASAPGAPPVQPAAAQPAPPSAEQHAPSSAPSPSPSCAPSSASSLAGPFAASSPRTRIPAPPRGSSALPQAPVSSRSSNKNPTGIVSLSQAEIRQISESERRQLHGIRAGVATGQGQIEVLEQLIGLSLHAVNPDDNNRLMEAMENAINIEIEARWRNDDSIPELLIKLANIATRANAMERALLLLAPPDRQYEMTQALAREARRFELRILNAHDQQALDSALGEASAMRFQVSKYAVYDPKAPKPRRKDILHDLLDDLMKGAESARAVLEAQYPRGLL